MNRTLQLATVVTLLALSAQAASIFAPRGRNVYEQTCVACHADGVSGAPRLGDRNAWAPRIARGQDALVASALNGKGQMPPKGSNPGFSEEDIRAAVEYIVANAR